jgi:hypothetical protein
MDASALIDLGERHYPENLPVFKPIWDFLYAGIDTGDIISVDFVAIELSKRASEWREAFLDRSASMYQMSDEIEAEFGNVVREIERNPKFRENKHRDRFMNGADPWLIALAKCEGEASVVSAEAKSLTDYGLGAVCGELGVRHINLVQLFSEHGIGS